MPKSNMADPGYEGEVLGFNNIELTQEDVKTLESWFKVMTGQIDEGDPALTTMRLLLDLVSSTAELGEAHTEDTKEKTVIVLAADYVIADEDDEEEKIDPTEDAEEPNEANVTGQASNEPRDI